MALTKALALQGSTPTTVDATDSIAFHDGTFDEPITVGSYNDGTSVRSSGGVNDSSANTPHNSKYLTTSTVSINGAGSTALSGVSTANCPLKYTISESTSITVTDITMFGYDGTTESAVPTDTTLYLAEQGDTNWTQAEGNAAAMSLTDSSTPATSHSFYVLISASPESIGVKSANKIKFAFTYQ
jgi:hypothetical protein